MGELTIQGAQAQHNLLEWSRRVADCRSSGLSVTRWCAELNIPLKWCGLTADDGACIPLKWCMLAVQMEH